MLSVSFVPLNRRGADAVSRSWEKNKMELIERLKCLIEKNPEDAFPRYGLAMEYRKKGHHKQAIRVFEDLLGYHPEYIPAYLQFGMSLVVQGDHQEAREVFSRGVNLAIEKKQDHAREELQAALSELLEQME